MASSLVARWAAAGERSRMRLEARRGPSSMPEDRTPPGVSLSRSQLEGGRREEELE
jgi:hypothetical protein